MWYRVRGVDRMSGQPMQPMVFDVSDEKSALAAAAAAGMLVDGVEELPSPTYSGHSNPSRPHGSGIGFRCPFCQSTVPPRVRHKISTAGWVIFVVLLLVCFPFCLIGLFIKEDYRVCRSCGIKLD